MEVIRWGIMGSGIMANDFAKGLKYAEHGKLVAVASRSMEKSQSFAKKYNISKVYDSYSELTLDKDIDVVYIATPNSLHEEHSILCLNNNKHVLCEKPFATNKQAAQRVIKVAKERNLFCMEAMWSRFMPIIDKVKLIIQSGKIGEIKMFTASFGKLKEFDLNNNVYKKKLGGGCLLDLGVYPISLALYFLGHPIESKGFLSFGESGVDEQASIMLKFPNGCQAFLSSNFNVNYENNIKIYGTSGVITVHEPMYRAAKITINKYSYTDKLWKKILLKIQERYLGKTLNISVKGNGYNYEADEVAMCLKDGKIESPKMSWEDTLNVLEIVDKVKREAEI